MIITGKTYSSLEEALNVLGASFVKRGEEVRLFYRSADGLIDVLVAIGTDSGIGPGHYSILSTSGIQIVTLVDSLPDSSALVAGDLYVWIDAESGKNYFVFLDHREREVLEIVSEVSVTDKKGIRYYIGPDYVKSIKDFATSYDIDKLGKLRFVTEDEYSDYSDEEKAREGNSFMICKKQNT